MKHQGITGEVEAVIKAVTWAEGAEKQRKNHKILHSKKQGVE